MEGQRVTDHCNKHAIDSIAVCPTSTLSRRTTYRAKRESAWVCNDSREGGSEVWTRLSRRLREDAGDRECHHGWEEIVQMHFWLVELIDVSELAAMVNIE